MKKRNSLIIGCLFVTLFCCVLLSSMDRAQAANSSLKTAEDYREREQLRIESGGIDIEDADDEIDWVVLIGGDGTVPLDAFCSNCNWFNTTVCAKEGVYDNEWYHNTLLTNNCKITSLKSRGARMCPICQTVWEIFP